MFDRSLVFFYIFVLLLIAHSIIASKRDPYRKYTLTFMLCLLLSVVFSSFHYGIGSGAWCTSVILISLSTYFLGITLFKLLPAYLRIRHVKKITHVVKAEGYACFNSLFLNEHNGYRFSLQWFVLYFPAQNTLEIGASIFHKDIKINKKLYSKTLSGRILYMTPISILDKVTLEQNALYPIKMFMQHSEEATELVMRYIDAIKNGSSEPWKLFEPKVVSADVANVS